MGEPPDRDLPPERRVFGARAAAALALSLSLVTTSAGAWAGTSSSSPVTVLCTTKAGSGYRSLTVDQNGRLAELLLRQAALPGYRVELEGASTSNGRRAFRVRAVASMRVFGPSGEPFVVRTRLIENDSAHYGFYRDGHSWGCPVAFDDEAAVSVAKLILTGHSVKVMLKLHNGRLVHLDPREMPLVQPAQVAKARSDLQYFLALLAHGNSIAACAALARDALLIHGGRNGCVMAFESARFLYRERYARASVRDVALFNLNGYSYALATIRRTHGHARALLIRERGTYHYLGDLQLSPIELW